MLHFGAVLRGEEQPRTGIDDGVRALEIAEAATRSWKEGRPVAL
jgi:myo-inositol 2-dehydrogenase/D-chiro-inositol 1-dehydrogenase